ncbi:MAG: O-methyltransferase [Lachnospiraceae bacterium]|nr:O-methyltransferase [Candidatus Fimimorpha excrementavium]
MIVNERITAYINSLEVPGSDISEQIKKEALADRVPIIRSETASLLKFFVSFAKPMQILEVGTAVGYSAIMMSEVMPEGAAITTIEKYEPRIPVARENFRRAGKEGVITLLEGDAMEWLARLSGPYDMIFMDAAKGQYIHFFPEIMRLLSDGGILISDNIFQDGDIMESRFAVTRRNRTIHSRMREYLYTLKHTEGLVTSLIPIGDGVAVSTKKKG